MKTVILDDQSFEIGDGLFDEIKEKIEKALAPLSPDIDTFVYNGQICFTEDEYDKVIIRDYRTGDVSLIPEKRATKATFELKLVDRDSLVAGDVVYFTDNDDEPEYNDDEYAHYGIIRDGSSYWENSAVDNDWAGSTWKAWYKLVPVGSSVKDACHE